MDTLLNKKSRQAGIIDAIRNDSLIKDHLYREVGGFTYDRNQDEPVYKVRNKVLAWEVSRKYRNDVAMLLSFKSKRFALLAFYVFVRYMKINIRDGSDKLVRDKIDALDFNDVEGFANIMKENFPLEYISIGKLSIGAISLIKKMDGYHLYYYSSDRIQFSWYSNPIEPNRAFVVYYNYCSVYRKYMEQIVPTIEKYIVDEAERDLLVTFLFYGNINKVTTDCGKAYRDVEEYINDRARELGL